MICAIGTHAHFIISNLSIHRHATFPTPATTDISLESSHQPSPPLYTPTSRLGPRAVFLQGQFGLPESAADRAAGRGGGGRRRGNAGKAPTSTTANHLQQPEPLSPCVATVLGMSPPCPDGHHGVTPKCHICAPPPPQVQAGVWDQLVFRGGASLRGHMSSGGIDGTARRRRVGGGRGEVGQEGFKRG